MSDTTNETLTNETLANETGANETGANETGTNETGAPVPAAAGKSYGSKRPKVPPFARYRGTSAWVKNKRRVRAYAMFKAAEKAKGADVRG